MRKEKKKQENKKIVKARVNGKLKSLSHLIASYTFSTEEDHCEFNRKLDTKRSKKEQLIYWCNKKKEQCVKGKLLFVWLAWIDILCYME